MGLGPTGLKTVLLASIVALATPLTTPHAQASTAKHKRPVTQVASGHHGYVRNGRTHHAYVHQRLVRRPYVLVHPEYGRRALVLDTGLPEATRNRVFGLVTSDQVIIRRGVASRAEPGRHWAARGGMSCVPFARQDSGINLVGNAWQWWDLAAGVYARGRVPETGSVLAFKANPHMRLGHVAVVSRVINRREIEIDQANWWSEGIRGGVSRDVPVVDVSEANDWTAVRVGLGDGIKFGAVYPTHGFIYDRPDTGVIAANVTAPAPQPELNPAPRDLRSAVERPWRTYEEVAEAAETEPGRKAALHTTNSRRTADDSPRQ